MSGTFSVTITNNGAVVKTNLTTGAFDVIDGSPPTLINGYTQSNRNFVTSINFIPYMPGFASVVTNNNGTFDVGNPLPGFNPSTGLIVVSSSKIHPLSSGEYVKFIRNFINSPQNVIGPFAGNPGGLQDISFNISDYTSYFLLMSDIYEVDILSVTFNCFLPQYNVTFAPWDLGFRIVGNYDIISSQWRLTNLTHPNVTNPLTVYTGDILKIDTPDNSYDFTTINKVSINGFDILSPFFLVWAPLQIQLKCPVGIPVPVVPIVTIAGTQFTGSAVLAPIQVVVANSSGIYTVVTGKTNDTLYNNSITGNTTSDTAIPNPFIKTGFIGA